MRISQPLLRVLLLACLIGLSHAHAAAQHFTFQQYGQPEGLHNLNVSSMLQDHDGFLWVGTENGLYRFDSSVFSHVQTVEGVDDPDIAAIHQDSIGRIWVLTLHDLFYAERGSFRKITTQQKLETDLRSSLTSFLDDPNHIFLLNNGSLDVVTSSDTGRTWQISPFFSAQQLATNPDLKGISGVLAGRDRHLWIGCGQHLCSVYQGSVQVLGPAQGLPEDRWKPVLIDSHGTLWARGSHHIVSCTLAACMLRDGNLNQLLKGTRNGILAEDSSGRILANLAIGIARFENGVWKIFNSDNGIPPFPVQYILVDHQGSPWLALSGHGLARWKGSDTWEAYTTAEGLDDNQIWGIHAAKHGLWVGTQFDLQFLPDGSRKFIHRQDSGSHRLPAVQALAISNEGYLWGGELDGDLFEYDPVKHQSRAVTNLQTVYSLLKDNSGKLWICSKMGLFILDVNFEHGNQPTPVTAVPRARFYKAVQDQSGSLWFTSEKGIFRFEKNQWGHIPLPTNFKQQFSEYIALEPDGSFWINGIAPISLLHARIQKGKLQVLDQIPPTDLSSSEIIDLNVDSRGWLWVGTDAGIDVFNGKKWRRITEDDGLIWNDIDEASFFSAPDGTVWIGTSAGLAHLVHPENLFRRESLTTWITEAKLGPIVFANQYQGRNISLPWNHLPVTFRLATSDLAAGNAIVFRYRLLNEEDWNSTSNHELRYPPLTPGNYRLDVIAEDTARHITAPAVSLSFTILAPWWKTKTFYALTILFVIFLAWLLLRWYLRFLILRQRHLQRLVEERTEELQLIATRDSLTGLLNRAAIFEQLEREIHNCHRRQGTLAIALADLDRFKEINDTYGHLIGDYFLQEYANRISTAVRAEDYVGRYGGEELLIIFPNLAPDLATKQLEDLRLAVCEVAFQRGNIIVNVTCSFGLAWLDSSTYDCESLVEQADRALYRAKMKGRNRVEYDSTSPSTC
jgi:diguanylate cyclase (GGDEF)-like protein